MRAVKDVRNIEVIKSIECVRQHYLLVMKWELKPLKQQLTTRTQKVRGWKLRNETTRAEFSELVEREVRRQRQRTGPSAETNWQQFKETIMTAAEKVCGVSKGSCRERKTWIWTNEVKQAVNAKR